MIFVFSHAVYCFKSLSLYKYSYSQLFQVMCRDAWELPSLALVGGEFSGVVQSCCTISRSTIFTNKSLKNTQRLVQPIVQGNSFFSVIGQETCEYLNTEENNYLPVFHFVLR